MLVDALETTFTSTSLFAPHFIPLALDKLSSSVRWPACLLDLQLPGRAFHAAKAIHVFWTDTAPKQRRQQPVWCLMIVGRQSWMLCQGWRLPPSASKLQPCDRISTRCGAGYEPSCLLAHHQASSLMLQ